MNEKDEKKISDKYLYLILIGIFILTYILFLGSCPLLDVDETRYVDIAKKMLHTKDYLTLYLNGEYFFEKPPLFFWLEILSFKLTGVVNEWSARLPIVLLSIIPSAFLFMLSKKVENIKFGFINTLILMTSLEYIILTKIAILDSVLTSTVTTAVFCYFFTFFVKEENKKYFWALVYIFTGLAVLAKGIPGVAIPCAVIFVASIYFKTYKETLKSLIWGIPIFLVVVLPWHIIMLFKYKALFFDEYIIKHHLLRFIGSDIINRRQPFYFFVLTILWGFFPYIFTLLGEIPNLFKKKSFSISTNCDKFIFLNIIAAVMTLLFFSSSSTKLITYILPIYPYLAVIVGKSFYDFIINDRKSTKISLIILNILLVVGAIGGLFLNYLLPSDYLISVQSLQRFGIVAVILFSTINIYLLVKNKRFLCFISLAIFMAFLSCIGAPIIYKYDYSFGQDDLIKFAKFAKENNYTISTRYTGARYSLLYYSDSDKVYFDNKNAKTDLLIVKNCKLKKLNITPDIKGVKYSMIMQNKNN